MESKGKWPQGKRSGLRSVQEWNDAISDLSSMKLSKEELAKMHNSRQSHNLAIARAELIERNRQKGKGRSACSFSPSLSAKLRASGSKTVEEVLADGSAAISLAQKIRSGDLSEPLSQVEEYFRNQNHPSEKSNVLKHYLDEDSDDGILGETERNLETRHEKEDHHLEEKEERERNEMSVVQRGTILSSGVGSNPYPLSPQGWQNLHNTIQLVVKTCEALWQQLEEERLTRQRLHFQLQEQRSVITTLTAELLQIQEHQELILKELESARSSNLSYPVHIATRDQFLQQQQQQQHKQQQQQFQLPSKTLPDPLFKSGRFMPRPYAFSESSIDARPRNKVGNLEHPPNFTKPPSQTTDQFFRLGLQGKSKSASQLDRTHELENAFEREQRNLNPHGVDFLHEASVLSMLRNYHISEG